MTEKELIIKSLLFEETERIPVTILTGVTWTIKRNHLSPIGMLRLPDAGAKLMVDSMEEIGSDIVFGGRVSPYVIIRAMGGIVDSSKVGLPTSIIHCPLKEVSDVRDMDIEEVTKRILADEEYQLMVTQTRNMRQLLGQRKFIAVGGFAPFTMASQMVGVTKFLEAIFDEDENIPKLLSFATEVVYRFTEGFVKAGGDMIYIADPVASGDLISPDMYQETALPPLKEMVSRFKPICDYFLFHICGNTMKRVVPVSKSGVGCFSVDSIDVKEAMKLAEGRIAIMGNLNPANVLETKKPEEIYAMSLDLCKNAGLHGGFWLGPGCDLAPDTPLENLKAMVKAAHDVHK